MSNGATRADAVYRWWMLRPNWVRILGTAAFLGAFAPFAVWQLTRHSVLLTLLAALALAVLGGLSGAADERKTRRMPAMVGWTGDHAAFTRVRADADADADELPADPALRQVARDYAIYRLANPRHRRRTSRWSLLLIPLLYLVIAALYAIIGSSVLAAVWLTLGIGTFFTSTSADRHIHVLPPRWRRVANRTGKPESIRS